MYLIFIDWTIAIGTQIKEQRTENIQKTTRTPTRNGDFFLSQKLWALLYYHSGNFSGQGFLGTRYFWYYYWCLWYHSQGQQVFGLAGSQTLWPEVDVNANLSQAAGFEHGPAHLLGSQGRTIRADPSRVALQPSISVGISLCDFELTKGATVWARKVTNDQVLLIMGL